MPEHVSAQNGLRKFLGKVKKSEQYTESLQQNKLNQAAQNPNLRNQGFKNKGDLRIKRTVSSFELTMHMIIHKLFLIQI